MWISDPLLSLLDSLSGRFRITWIYMSWKLKTQAHRSKVWVYLSCFVTCSDWANYFLFLNLFPSLQNSNNIYLIVLLRSLNEIMPVKCEGSSWLVLNIESVLAVLLTELQKENINSGFVYLSFSWSLSVKHMFFIY